MRKENDEDIEYINDIYLIPANTEFWSIALQESILCKRDLYVKITHVEAGSGKPCGGILQERFDNLMLQEYIGNDAISYVDKHNGEIDNFFSNCRLIKKHKKEENILIK